MTDHRALIAGYVAVQGRWRAQQAQLHPEDAKRNLRAASALLELSGYILELDAGDRRLQRIGELLAAGRLGAHFARGVSQFRLNNPAAGCETFIAQLVDVAEQEAAGLGRRRRRVEYEQRRLALPGPA